MDIRYKKIIAKEFLILISCILTIPLIYFGIITYNYIQKPRLTNLISIKYELIAEIKHLEETRNLKRKNRTLLYNASNNYLIEFSPEWCKLSYLISKKNSDHNHYNNPKKLWNRLLNLQKQDSLVYYWDFKLTNNFKSRLSNLKINNAYDLEAFILNNTHSRKDTNKISENYKEIENLDNRIRRIRKYIRNDEIISVVFSSFFIILFLAFGTRYLFKAVIWSIKTLKR